VGTTNGQQLDRTRPPHSAVVPADGLNSQSGTRACRDGLSNNRADL
jgi:hypothetical protein